MTQSGQHSYIKDYSNSNRGHDRLLLPQINNYEQLSLSWELAEIDSSVVWNLLIGSFQDSTQFVYVYDFFDELNNEAAKQPKLVEIQIGEHAIQCPLLYIKPEHTHLTLPASKSHFILIEGSADVRIEKQYNESTVDAFYIF